MAYLKFLNCNALENRKVYKRKYHKVHWVKYESLVSMSQRQMMSYLVGSDVIQSIKEFEKE